MRRFLPKILFLVLGILSYLIMHQFHTALGGSGHEGSAGARITFWGQFVLPLVFLLGAVFTGRSAEPDRRQPAPKTGAGGKKKAQRRARPAAVEPFVRIDPFHTMEWDEFSRLLISFFQKNGFSISTAPSVPGDGIDFALQKNGQDYIAQCKHWREARVDLNGVREHYHAMQMAKAHGVFVVTTGEFTVKAIGFAEDKNISLIDGLKLRRLLKTPPDAPAIGAVSADEAEPGCPRCGGRMRLRTASRGVHIGKRVWVCVDQPRCDGSVLIQEG